MREKLQEYALIAEIIGGLAIVASLLFVGMQIRISAAETERNTATAKTLAYQNLMDGLNGLNALVLQDDHLTTLWKNRYELLRQELDPSDLEKLVLLNRILWRTYDAAYYSYVNGNLGELEWGRFTATICRSSDELKKGKYDIWSQLEYVTSEGLDSYIQNSC